MLQGNPSHKSLCLVRVVAMYGNVYRIEVVDTGDEIWDNKGIAQLALPRILGGVVNTCYRMPGGANVK